MYKGDFIQEYIQEHLDEKMKEAIQKGREEGRKIGMKKGKIDLIEYELKKEIMNVDYAIEELITLKCETKKNKPNNRTNRKRNTKFIYQWTK